MKYNRGGKTLGVGKIGRMKVLRQLILYPGEKLSLKLKGNCRIAGLRQQTSVYTHVKVDAFAAPLRWFYTAFPDYLKEGTATAKTIPVQTGTDWTANRSNISGLGIGHINADFCKWFSQMPIAVWNEWYRWAEDSKVSLTSPPISFYQSQGQKCVNLPSAASRMHDAPVFDATEYQVPSATVLDVRDLELYKARFAQAAETDWNSQERYMVFMQDVFGAPGSNEVDQVPIRLKRGAELSVMPRDMYATDGGSLGEIMSINNFQVNHIWDDFVAKEHMIICIIQLVRFAPIMEDGVMPGIYPAHTPYFIYQGDPNIIGAKKPNAVVSREVDGDGDSTIIGYLGSGWQMREGYNHVDSVISNINQFPLLDGQAGTAASYRDASLVNEATFRSTILHHFFLDYDFTCDVQSRVPSAGESIMAGSGKSGPKGNHPTGGFLT